MGAAVTDAMGRLAPEGLIGIHTNLLVPALGGRPMPCGTPTRNAPRSSRLDTFRTSGSGYFLEQATRPQTIGYALLDSPVALAAWMLDHDTDSYYKIAQRLRRRRALGQSHPGPHPRQHHAVLADRHRRLRGPVVLGERTGPGRSAAAGQAPPPCTIPVGFTTFPGEIWRAAQLGREGYPNLIYFNEVDKGGHFAAWEEPELFSTEIRAAFRSLR